MVVMIKLIEKFQGSNCSIIDIITATCAAEDCLDCSTSTQCRRCAYFLAKGSRECLSTCTGEAKFVYSGDVQGSICVGKFWPRGIKTFVMLNSIVHKISTAHKN